MTKITYQCYVLLWAFVLVIFTSGNWPCQARPIGQTETQAATHSRGLLDLATVNPCVTLDPSVTALNYAQGGNGGDGGDAYNLGKVTGGNGSLGVGSLGSSSGLQAGLICEAARSCLFLSRPLSAC